MLTGLGSVDNTLMDLAGAGEDNARNVPTAPVPSSSTVFSSVEMSDPPQSTSNVSDFSPHVPIDQPIRFEHRSVCTTCVCHGEMSMVFKYESVDCLKMKFCNRAFVFAIRLFSNKTF